MLKTIEMKKSEMIDMYVYCSAYKADPSHTKNIKYCVTFAKKKLEPDATSLIETYKATEEYNNYENERTEIVIKYAEKDENGNPIEIQSGVYKINKEVIDDAKAEIAALEVTNKALIDERQKDLAELDEKLKEKMEIELEVLDYNTIPEDVDEEFLRVMFPIIIKE